MRLKQIKLAGFKSFVEPTKVPFVQQMTAIVGPNGCGKSNIIDAVRWVLGESSAKNLRGDAMTDVIFNGAASRKPVGQASVELIFEHSDNTVSDSLAQHLADRNEISIRRVVNREGINSYFLNGSKCRRKDITDIFLGTGLGPRSYAIIEQGTISRLIESKPQELRVFIEEAAGISKYKERRRDTENRIKHTRENLARLSDIRFELGQQIEKLDQQAQAAKRFRTLKSQERTFKAELALLRHQKYQAQAQAEQTKINQLQQQIEQLVLDQIAADNQISKIRTANSEQSQTLEALQSEKVRLSSQVVRLEQNIKHATSRLKVLSQERDKHQLRHQQLDEQLAKELSELSSLQQIIEKTSPLVEQSKADLGVLNDDISQLKQQSQDAQARYQAQAQKAQQQAVKKSSLQVNIEHAKTKQQQLLERQRQLTQKLQQEDSQQLNTLIEQEASLVEQLTALQTSRQQELTQHGEQTRLLRQNATNIEQSITQANWQISQLSQQAEKLSQSLAISDDDNSLDELLTNHQITLMGKLYQHIRVDETWLVAAEKVLAPYLEAQITADDITSLTDFDGQYNYQLLIKSSQPIPVKANSLASKIDGIEFFPWLISQLNHIQLVTRSSELSAQVNNLVDGDSLITPSGKWLSANFISVGQLQNTPDVLDKQHQLRQIDEQLTQLNQHLERLNDEHQAATQSCAQSDQQLNQIKQQLIDTDAQLNSAKQTLALNQQAYRHQLTLAEQAQEQLAQIDEQLIELEAQLSELIYSQDELQEQGDIDLNTLEQASKAVNDALNQKQQAFLELQQTHHEHKVTLETALTKQKSAQIHQLRLEEQLHGLSVQLQEVGFEQDNLTQPLSTDEQALTELQLQLHQLEEKLALQHQLLAGASEQIAKCEQDKKQIFSQIERDKESLNKLYINQQNYQLRAETALEAIPEHMSLSQIKANMPSHAKESLWQANINRLAQDISRLGAINLAAIDEFEAQLARKQYLDQQDSDLNQALETLEGAIAKIDRESRAKFKSTFEQVNHDLQQLFPKVFGGGSAYLELTGDDLLDTGVTIMARPPGKKNSTIHLLSGGEKALTALSLVFAIFRLNPAPFCMLDEVDAPLDDANVGRFCNLVREMSQTVQFIYISHNKIAMEMASQLTGVTMYEPGVSRMVAVDIDEAVAMAELS
ncbi:chromosome segregation protein SMC [Thalassotalea sp. LPB0316]|uniref:chromosome segregation protein SMC n=1 Tax=Thalassotalea sp. LPB0316 TaxID=2769490 RepID=UPI00186874E0|nr:chromosome segregation protein SMC [Thalassotalea sp. LPB0316]QOL25267.1 chromosome segregation protein SMC [Thalassotalea sp. LPB0316]